MKLLKTAALAALISSTALAAQAQEVTLRLSHWVPATHPIHVYGMTEWADSIREASEGRIEIQIYPAQQLGQAADHYDMARDGIADITFTNPGYQAGRFPIYGLAEQPFHGNNAVAAATALHEWYEPIAEREMSDVYFCMINPHDPGTIHSNTPIKVPADVAGKNIRPAHATMARFVSLLGGNAFQVSAPEVRDAISRGIADALTFPWNSVYIFGIQEAVNFSLDMPFYLSNHLILFNPAVVEGLSEENRQVIEDHCTPEWSARFSEGWAADEQSGRQKMIDDPNHEVYTPTAEEVALWREAAAPLLDQWRADVSANGEDADAIYQSYVEALQRHDSLFE